MGYLLKMQDEKLEIENEKEPDINNKEKQKCLLLCYLLTFFSTSIHRVINGLKKIFNLSWIRVIMYYHRFNNLDELLNGDLAAKIGRGICSKDLMDRECNCFLTSKVNGNSFMKVNVGLNVLSIKYNALCVTVFM